MRFGFVKPTLDAHTLGLASVVGLLRDSGQSVAIAPTVVSSAVDEIRVRENYRVFKDWVSSNRLDTLGLSYRLDPAEAVELFDRLVAKIDSDPDLGPIGSGPLRTLVFAGLPAACDEVRRRHGDRFVVFRGDEEPPETLAMLGVARSAMPDWLLAQGEYDELRLKWGREFLETVDWETAPAPPPWRPSSSPPSLFSRLQEQAESRQGEPLLRFHVGPYSEDRDEAVDLCRRWLHRLDASGQVDVVSVGSSQLTQERFGESWDGHTNGGGVPVATEAEFRSLRLAAGNMLVRAYSGTRDVADYARMLERTIDNAWHALSFWWFNRLDGRGPMTLREGLKQHVAATAVAAEHRKPFEPNVAHHFAFRGGDDVTGLVAVVLAIHAAVRVGVRTVVLQTMLNTPRLTSGVADIAKARALMELLAPLQQSGVRIVLQPRAGLSYFSTDLDKARIQLAASTALMNDIVPSDASSPQIIHVVSYSEATALADPSVIEESARITRAALRTYRESNTSADILTSGARDEINRRQAHLVAEASVILRHIRATIPTATGPDGLYQVMKKGYLAVPQLWHEREEFGAASNWNTRVIDGGVEVVDEAGVPISAHDRLAMADSR